MSTLEHAIELAVRLHAGQLDKTGEPYILHPLRVMLAVEGETARSAAVLHDVVEDCSVTLEDLRREGFDEVVLQAVDAMTHRPGEDYEAYAQRAAADPLGRVIKRADLQDNLRLSAALEQDPANLARRQKYQRALRILDDVAGADNTGG